MSLLTDFPNAVEYQRDLGYLIEQYKKLSNLYEEYGDRITAIENEISGLPAYIQRLVYEQTQLLREQINKELAEMQEKIENNTVRVDELSELVYTLQNQYLELTKMIVDLMHFCEVYTEKIGENVYQRLAALVEEWTQELPVIICPVDNKQEGIETVVNHIYSALRLGISAGEYDNLRLSAEQYENIKIKAITYDTRGLYILTAEKKCYMISPFDGNYTKISSVVQKLADFHKKAITAGSFDLLNLDADNFDTMLITTYEFDWNNPLTN